MKFYVMGGMWSRFFVMGSYVESCAIGGMWGEFYVTGGMW